MQLFSDNPLIPFVFEGLALQESCWIDGRPYFTRRAIGEFLEYNTSRRDPIGHILRRNPHIDQFSVPVSLSGTDGKYYEQKVYDPIGLQLIIFESHQPKAKLFKVAVAHLVYAFMKGELLPSCWSRKGDRLPKIKQLLSHPPNYKRRNIVEDIAQSEGKSTNTIYHWVKKSGHRLLTKSGNPRKTRSDAGPIRPQEVTSILQYWAFNPGAHGTEIKAALNLNYSISHINRILRINNSGIIPAGVGTQDN